MRYIFLTISITATAVFLAVVDPHFAAAQEKFVPLTAIPGVTSGNASLIQYINALFRLGIGLAALFAVIRLGIAGIKYMGSDSFSSKSDAKSDIQEVFLGLLIILATVIILQTINPGILRLDNILGEGGNTFRRSGSAQSTAPASSEPWNNPGGAGGAGEVDPWNDETQRITLIPNSATNLPGAGGYTQAEYNARLNTFKAVCSSRNQTARRISQDRQTGDVWECQ